MNLAGYIDHTLLRAQAVPADIDALCAEAVRYGFAAVCVNPLYVERATSHLKASGVKVASVVGFPLGASRTVAKVYEAEKAIGEGAGEIDMVMPIGLFLGGEERSVARDIARVVRAAGHIPVKVIIETCYLTPHQIGEASKLACEEGAAFIKTSTGFGTRGASVEDIVLIKKAVGDRCLIKASGGIRTREGALALIKAGASRIGTSSGVEIVKGEKRDAD